MSSQTMSIYQFVDAGRITTVQGIPFRGHRHMGLPLAGAADPLSMALANWMVGNYAETPAYEITLAPVRIKIMHKAHIAVAGAADHVLIDGTPKKTDRAFILKDKQTLEIPVPKAGCRSYLATCGGVPCDKMLGASSTYTPLLHTNSRYIPDGYGPQAFSSNACTPQWAIRELPPEYRLAYSNQFLLRFLIGPEQHWLCEGSIDRLCAQEWTVGQRSNRMGLQLEGSRLAIQQDQQLPSSAVFPGTIQLPPSGLPFLLGPDAQTTGGYPRIGQVIRADRHLIGQLRPGAKIRLQQIEPAEARRLYRSKIALLRQIQPDIQLD